MIWFIIVPGVIILLFILMNGLAAVTAVRKFEDEQLPETSGPDERHGYCMRCSGITFQVLEKNKSDSYIDKAWQCKKCNGIVELIQKKS